MFRNYFWLNRLYTYKKTLKIIDATATSNRSADASASAFGILDDGMSGSITNAGQNFLNAHAAVSNHFNLGRHLVSANHYRDLREDAFKNWNRAVA